VFKKVTAHFLVIIMGLLVFSGSALAASIEAGEKAFQNGNYQEAFEELMPLAKEGDKLAQLYVGQMYYTGKGLPVDYVQARKLLTKAAEHGYIWAQESLAEIYEHGYEVAIDYRKAYSLYLTAYKHRKRVAYPLSKMYEFGRGVDPDKEQAEQLRKEAAEAGVSAARWERVSIPACLNSTERPCTLLKTASMGNIERLNLEILSGADIEEIIEETQRTALMEAVVNGDLTAVNILLEAGANPSSSGQGGYTALHYAANNTRRGNRANDRTIAEALLDAGANINARMDTGQTPLYWAVINRRSDVRDLLIKRGAGLDIPNNDGWTPLHAAISSPQHYSSLKPLLNAGARTDIRDKDGFSPLRMAIQLNNQHAIDLLR